MQQPMMMVIAVSGGGSLILFLCDDVRISRELFE
jgi:hypothetical protein